MGSTEFEIICMQARQRAHDETCVGRAKGKDQETEQEEKEKWAFLMHAFLTGRMVMSQPGFPT